jgi:integrase
MKVPGLYEKPNSPYWYACYLAPLVDPTTGRMLRRADGKVRTRQLNRSTGETSQSRAKAVLDGWKADATRLVRLSLEEEEDRLRAREERERAEERQRADQEAKTFTMQSLSDLWFAHKSSSKKTIKDDRTRFETILSVLTAEKPVADLTPDDVLALKEGLIDGRFERRKLKPASVNMHLRLLRAALRLAAKRGRVLHDPMAGVSLYKTHARDRICTPDEFKAIVGVAEPELRLAVIIGNATAMRLGEIVKLTWRRIDLAAGMVSLFEEHTKTDEARRVPLTKDVVSELEKWRGDHPGEFVFSIRTSSAMSKRFGELCDKLKIEDLTFHDLRHSACTALRRAGVDIFTIQRISGHKTLEVLKRYQTFDDGDLRSAVERAAKAQRRSK